MMKKTLNDYAVVIRTADVDERNAIITKLYSENKEYYYTDRQSDGKYAVAYNE